MHAAKQMGTAEAQPLYCAGLIIGAPGDTHYLLELHHKVISQSQTGAHPCAACNTLSQPQPHTPGWGVAFPTCIMTVLIMNYQDCKLPFTRNTSFHGPQLNSPKRRSSRCRRRPPRASSLSWCAVTAAASSWATLGPTDPTDSPEAVIPGCPSVVCLGASDPTAPTTSPCGPCCPPRACRCRGSAYWPPLAGIRANRPGGRPWGRVNPGGRGWPGAGAGARPEPGAAAAAPAACKAPGWPAALVPPGCWIPGVAAPVAAAPAPGPGGTPAPAGGLA